MEVGLLIRYGKLVPGRETAAMQLFGETITYFQDRLERGEITFFEPYFMMTSDLDQELGFFLIKGPAPSVFAMMEDDSFGMMMQRGLAFVEHLHQDLLTVGEGIAAQMERATKVHAELPKV